MLGRKRKRGEIRSGKWEKNQIFIWVVGQRSLGTGVGEMRVSVPACPNDVTGRVTATPGTAFVSACTPMPQARPAVSGIDGTEPFELTMLITISIKSGSLGWIDPSDKQHDRFFKLVLVITRTKLSSTPLFLYFCLNLIRVRTKLPFYSL